MCLGMYMCKLKNWDLPLRHCTLWHTATHCSTLQHTAAHCSTLQHTATHCSTLQWDLVLQKDYVRGARRELAPLNVFKIYWECTSGINCDFWCQAVRSELFYDGKHRACLAMYMFVRMCAWARVCVCVCACTCVRSLLRASTGRNSSCIIIMMGVI